MKQSAASRWPRRFLMALVLIGAGGAAFVAVRVFGLIAPVLAETADGADGPTSKPAKKPKPDLPELFFNTEPPPRLRLRIADKQMNDLRNNPRAYVKATAFDLPPVPTPPRPAAKPGQPPKPVREAATAYAGIGVHLKGAAGSFRGVDDRPAITVNFDKFNKGQKYHGVDKVALNNSVQDGTYLCEAVGAAVFHDAGIPTPRVTHAHVWLNDRDMGLYVVKEGFDGSFLKHFFHDNTGTLYEGPFLGDVDGQLPVKSNFDPKLDAKALAAAKAKAAARIKELCDAAREPDPVKRRARLDKVLDVDRFLTFLALEGMVAHWDGYGFNHNNYRVYDDPKSGKLVFMPHGMDQLFGNPDHGLIPGGAIVARAVVEAPDDRARYMERVAQLRETVFTPENLSKHVDEADARLAASLAQTDPNAARDHKNQAADLRRRIADRIKGIDRQLGVQPKPLKFDKAGVAALPAAKWEPGAGQGNAAADKFDEAGKPRLRVVCKNGGGFASWRQAVLLPQGKYVFEGQCRVSKVTVPNDGVPNPAAGLRISGATRTAKLGGTSAGWQKAEYEFEVTDPSREVVLVAELRATAGEAVFDPESLKLRRK